MTFYVGFCSDFVALPNYQNLVSSFCTSPLFPFRIVIRLGTKPPPIPRQLSPLFKVHRSVKAGAQVHVPASYLEKTFVVFPYIFFPLFIALSIVCVGAMLTEIMLVLKLLRCRSYLRIDQLGAVCHLGNFFKNDS